jgi:hypothetical protein
MKHFKEGGGQAVKVWDAQPSIKISLCKCRCNDNIKTNLAGVWNGFD